MECNKWEENGLLFASRELDEAQANQFRSHLSTCSYCSNELSLYALEKTKFFSPDVLSVQTTPELDIKILTRCTAVQPTHIGVFGSLWVKRVVFSALVFAFGAGAGGYFTFAYYHAKSGAAIAASRTIGDPSAMVSSSPATVPNSSSLSLDTSKHESIPGLRDKSSRTPSANKATGSSRGIIAVDLKKE
jgi:hypothetical protein